MANRVLQAKARKRMKQIRNLPRRMPEEVVGEFIPDNKVRPIPVRFLAEGMRGYYPPNQQVMQNYRNSARSLTLEEVFPRFLGTPAGRHEAELHLQRLQEAAEDMKSFTILTTSVHRARVFFNPTKTKFIISYENYKEGVIRTSMTYMFRQNAIDDFRSGKITWVEFGECSRSPRNSR